MAPDRLSVVYHWNNLDIGYLKSTECLSTLRTRVNINCKIADFVQRVIQLSLNQLLSRIKAGPTNDSTETKWPEKQSNLAYILDWNNLDIGYLKSTECLSTLRTRVNINCKIADFSLNQLLSRIKAGPTNDSTETKWPEKQSNLARESMVEFHRVLTSWIGIILTSVI
jgi:hypothetical protein